MTEPDRTPGKPGTPDIAAELRPYVDQPDSDAINEVAAQLVEDRPIPRAGFRADLRARLIELETKGFGWRPKNLRGQVAAYGVSGVALIVLGAITGPLG